MHSNYIVRLKNDKLMCFYHLKERGIFYRQYEGNKWSKETLLVNGARENYTVTLDKKSMVYMLCQNNYGDVVLFTNNDENFAEWTEKIILKNKSARVYPITLSPIITEKGMCLVYNVPIVEEKSNQLMLQTLNERGQWSQASKIDKFVNMSNFMFQVQKVTNEHMLVFYQTRTPEFNLGYREITPTNQSKFNTFHITTYQIADASFLTTDDTIHVLYIVKSMFSSQLIYRKKESAEFTNPVVISEGQRLEKCLLSFVNGDLHATYINNGQLYHSISENNGNSFFRPQRYSSKFCANPIKATFVSHETQDTEKYFIREVYVDANSPWDVQIIPEMYDEFYPYTNSRVVVAASIQQTNNRQGPSPTPAQAADTYGMDFIGMGAQGNYFQGNENMEHGLTNFEDESEKVQILKNQLAMAQRQNNEKDKQILSLANQLKKRGDEIYEIELKRKEFLKRTEEAKILLEEKVKQLESELFNERQEKAALLQKTNSEIEKEEVEVAAVNYKENVREDTSDKTANENAQEEELLQNNNGDEEDLV